MDFQKLDIVKLYDELDFKDVYVSILKTKEDIYTVKILTQPSYNLVSKRFSDSIFKQDIHPDDAAWQLPLNYNSEKMTIDVHKSMCKSIDKLELVKLLKHLTYINFSKTLINQSIISHSLEKLI